MALRTESLVYVVTVQDGFCYFSLESAVIPTKPHQPLSFNFPKRSFGKKRKVFLAKMVCKMAFLFLHYDESKDAVFCHTCLMGFKLKRMKTSMRADPTFVSSIAS